MKIRKSGNFWEIVKKDNSIPYLCAGGVYPGLPLPKFDSKKAAKKWLKMYIPILL